MSEVCRTFGISRKTGYSTAPAPSEGLISALTIRDIITAPIIADTATKARAVSGKVTSWTLPGLFLDHLFYDFGRRSGLLRQNLGGGHELAGKHAFLHT